MGLRIPWAILILSVLLARATEAQQTLAFRPTSTLQAETANNTSAADHFQSQPNGNAASGNVSKEPIRSLLYPGATTRIYAHFMGWFGEPGHMNVGYRSDDPAQVHRQIEDMISLGIGGVMIDWRGSSASDITNRTTHLVMKEAEQHPGFVFETTIDPKALDSIKPGDDATKALIRELKYVARTYFPSPAYMRVDGRPVVTNFELDRKYKINWSRVSREVPGDPLYLFQHASGFDHPYSSGSYSWIAINKAEPNDWGQKYLDDFYAKGRKKTAYTVGSVKPGFNDRFASWGLDRVMNRNCGQTWLKTFAEIQHFYSASSQLDALQIVTWNDYEEGTEIESGIENCAVVSAQLNGDDLQWSIAGRDTTKEDTINHYIVFISRDGENLMPLARVAAGVHTLDLGRYRLPAGKYLLFVKAVGVASVKNHISNAATYMVSNREPDALR
jgi:glycosyl hydrolase family 71